MSSSHQQQSSFVHLKVHSSFSFMNGVSSVDTLVNRAVECGQTALALTDYQSLSGVIRFYKACCRANIKPLIGVEVMVEPLSTWGQDETKQHKFGHARADGRGFSLTLLAKNFEGYRALCTVLSRAHLSRTAAGSLVSLEDIACFKEHLICLAGGPRSEVSELIMQGRYQDARSVCAQLKSVFEPADFYIELTHTLERQAQFRIRMLVQCAQEVGALYVATNDVHYAESLDRRVRDAVIAVSAHTRIPAANTPTNSEAYLKNAEQMRSLFALYPEACDETVRIAERIGFELPQNTFHFPRIGGEDKRPAQTVLAEVCGEQLYHRYASGQVGQGHASGVLEEAKQRLTYELSVIENMGFSDYFLIVNDIVQAARKRNIRCSGRGSAGDSIVSYLLGITDACPITYNLLFERFLNPARKQMPDIDIDFDSNRRDEIVEYIYERFGHDCVARVATMQTASIRSAVRIAGKAFGYTHQEVSRLTRGLPWTHSAALSTVLDTFPECRNHPLRAPEFRKVVELGDYIQGAPTHLGTHLGGLIITADPVSSWTPLQYCAKGTVVSQHDKDDIEALGLIKMDILGLKTHSVVDETFQRIKQQDPEHPDPYHLVPNDPAVYEMIQRGDTVGVFQLESSGQRNLSQRLKPENFEDIIAQTSLFRPGPLQADMVTPFVRRRHGLERVEVLHPALEPVLADTYGVIVYQEQVLRVAQEVAGFSLGEADLLRRAMTSHCSDDDMTKLAQTFISKAIENGATSSVADEVFRQLRGFAAYGFNKAHAACFSTIAYATAYLKRYYPAEFTAALLNNQPLGFYAPRVVLSDAKRHGITIKPIHINESEFNCLVDYSAKTPSIRIGLNYLRSLSYSVAQEVISERRFRAFESPYDLLSRCKISRSAVEALISIGAFEGIDCTGWERSLAHTASQQISAQLKHTGVSLCHPLDIVAVHLKAEGCVCARDITQVPHGSIVTVVGLREQAQTPRTRSHKRTCFLTLEDPTGLLDVVVFNDALNTYAEVITNHRCYRVTGKVQNTPEKGVAIIAQSIEAYRIPFVRLQGGVRAGAMGPSAGGASIPDEW